MWKRYSISYTDVKVHIIDLQSTKGGGSYVFCKKKRHCQEPRKTLNQETEYNNLLTSWGILQVNTGIHQNKKLLEVGSGRWGCASST